MPEKTPANDAQTREIPYCPAAMRKTFADAAGNRSKASGNSAPGRLSGGSRMKPPLRAAVTAATATTTAPAAKTPANEELQDRIAKWSGSV